MKNTIFFQIRLSYDVSTKYALKLELMPDNIFNDSMKTQMYVCVALNSRDSVYLVCK